MAKPGADRRDWKQSIRPALIISLIMGVVAGVVVTVGVTGGTKNGLNIQAGGIAFLIAFVVGVLVISLLMMVAKENPGDLGRGSGVNRSSQLSDDELGRLEAKERAVRAKVTPVSDAAAGATADAAAGDTPAGGSPAGDAAVSDAAQGDDASSGR